MEHKALYVFCIVVFLLVSLACYIIGRVKLKRNEIVLVANGWDVALLLVSAACFFLAYIANKEMWPVNETITFFCVAVVAFMGSIAMSEVHNWGCFWKIVVSVMAKVFMVLLCMLSFPIIAISSFVISILALVLKDYQLFGILNFKWLFDLIMGPRKPKTKMLVPEKVDDRSEMPPTLEEVG